MKIRITTGSIDSYRLGQTAEYPDDVAERLIARGFAEPIGETVPATQSAKAPTKAELQARCRDLGLSDHGNKDELQARIDECEQADVGESEAEIDDDEPPALSPEVPR